MQTNTSLRIFKLFALAPLASAVAAALVTPSAVAHSLVLTEVSSTVLTATYDASPLTVGNNGPDDWIVTAPEITFQGSGLIQTQWIEPENSSLLNALTHIGPNIGPGNFEFQSDIVIRGFTGQPNGSTVNDVGTDNRDFASVSMTFTDNAATAEHPAVPDTGSTLGLFLVSSIALVGARKLVAVRTS
jgi:hypothetical protein